MTGNERTTPLDPEEQALARRWRALPDGEPAPALDARIRAQAHAAARASRPKVRPWAWGLSTAAAAVLAIGMLWQSGLPPTSEEAMYRQVPGPPPEAVDALLEQEQAATVASDSADAAGARSEAASGAARESTPQAVLRDAPQPFEQRRESAGPAPERAAMLRKSLAPPTPIHVPDVPLTVPPLPEAAVSVPPAASTAPEAPQTMQAVPEPALAPAPPAPPRAIEQDRRQDEAPARARGPTRSAPAQRQAGALAEAAPVTEPPETPQAWIARIDALLAQGERAQALAELRDFIDAYPDYRLPRRLRLLLDNGR